MLTRELLLGDCVEVLRGLADDSVDSIVTDPPYGLSFMGKKWDYDVPGEDVWRECLRVLKPGGHLLAFAGTRTQHRMAVRIEDAGFEIRDMIAWVYGSGFPKSHNIACSIDKLHGHGNRGHRIAVANRHHPDGTLEPNGELLPAYEPKTATSRQWKGWGTALKPALEPITVARKPLGEKTVAANVLAHGTGGINVDGCRVGTDGGTTRSEQARYAESGWRTGHQVVTLNTGRWPANLIHDGSEEVVGLFPVTGASKATPRNNREFKSVAKGRDLPHVSFGHEDNGGSAARFFYCAKASKADRDEGCEGLAAIHRANGNKWTDQDYRVTSGERPSSAESGPRRNHHPTVKPAALMRYLCRLVTPPGGIVLDPFMGSGSTGKAAMLEGFRFIGIEREAEYMKIAEARIKEQKCD